MAGVTGAEQKVPFTGVIQAVQPRIRLMRSFDQRHHNYQGYVLRLYGDCASEAGVYLLGVGKAAYAERRFCVGMRISGMAVKVADPRLEVAQLYKVSGLQVLEAGSDEVTGGPPWRGVPPELEVYRERGHRRLDAKTYEAQCLDCIWGCRMPVELIIDQWDPSRKEYRFETFCYGPKSCQHYRAGAQRKVPGRRGMSYTEEDWVDEEATELRGPDE